MLDFLRREREKISYLFFGALTTLVNFVAYALLDARGLPTGWATGIATALSILFAYVTNRIWVFRSRTRGVAAWREFASFVLCRLGTLLIDMAVMLLGVDVLGVRLFSDAAAVWLRFTALDLWRYGVKLFSNVVVIVLNYVFSKLWIFRGKGAPGGKHANL